ncbi:transglutaminase family protein, partial [Prosthecobacter sp.]|uniref:transglutaminase family protein n=1 Tax=Prosthecobacter sp. TaxID=1965333 RepID=UPI00248766C2
MSIHVALHHRTSYHYERPIELGPQIIRLRPAPHSRSRILSYSLKVTPEKHFLNWQQDPQSNYLARLVIPEKTKEFSIEVDVVVEMAVFNPFDFFLEPEGEHFPFDYDAALDQELAPFLKCGELTPKLADYFSALERELLALDPWPPRTITALVTINQRLWKDISYTVRMEPGVQTPEESLTKRTGSCRDSSWLMVQIMRRLGIAARFVSGYLI